MAKTRNPKKPTNLKQENPKTHNQKPEKTHSWAALRSILTCKHLTQTQTQPHQEEQKIPKKESKMKCSGSLCSNTKVMQRPDASASSSSSSSTSPEEQQKNGAAIVVSTSSSSSSSSLSATSTSTIGGSLRGMPFRRFSGCYECKMVVDPILGFTKDPSLRSTICSCPQCGEVFMKPESLELHQAVRHAVSEMGPEDTSKNIVEIIFQSSWLKKQSPVCTIHRILKVQNTPKTISRFEEYRDSIRAKAAKQLPKKHPRCIADGNELLRFHCTTFRCSLGLNGTSTLCNSIPNCNVCSIIRNGFKVAGDRTVAGKGILTTATSGRAHDSVAAGEDGDDRRAMLVCRVIAGRVKKGSEGIAEEYDSVAGAAGVYSNLDELYVANHRAILPCFVVIYGGF